MPPRRRRLRLRAPLGGPARVHPASRPRHGHHLPGQERHGQDGGVRARDAAPARAGGRRGLGARAVPHARARVPDQERVRALLQVLARRQGRRLLRRRERPAEQAGAQDEHAARRRRHAGAHPGAHQVQGPRPVQTQALRHGRVRPDARGPRHAQRHPRHLPRDAAPEAGHDVLGDARQGDPPGVQEVLPGPHGNLRRRRHQAHAPRPPTVLRQAPGGREEPQAQRPPRRPRLQPGRHLRLQGCARDRARPTALRVQLPVDLHPLGHDAGRAHHALQGLQGLQEAHPRLDRPLRPRHRHRARQHRHQLRLPRSQGGRAADDRLRPISAPRRPRRPLRHQGPRHLLHLLQGGRRRARQGPVALRGQHLRTPRLHRHLLLHGLSVREEERTTTGLETPTGLLPSRASGGIS
mmetsp:Transcript_23860/g.94629  ORF Transcript_23860/g.94629 Transcript_23860/m.94629 type:complete len:409 (-) Transcript_23860:1115-2341(-)